MNEIINNLEKSFHKDIYKQMVCADARNNYLKNHKPHLVVLFRDVFYNACFEELYLGNAE